MLLYRNAFRRFALLCSGVLVVAAMTSCRCCRMTADEGDKGAMEKISMMNVFDVSLEDFPRLAGEQSDNGRFNRAVAAAADRVLFVPAGVYELSEPRRSTTQFAAHAQPPSSAPYEMDYVLV